MKVIFLALFAIAYSSSFLPTPELQDKEGSNCDTSLTAYTVTVFEVTPNPPEKNKSIHLEMMGTVTTAQQLKEIAVYVKFNGVNFYQTSFPETADCQPGTPCKATVDVFLPGIAPAGRYSILSKLKNTGGDYLNCWQYNFSL